MVLTAPKQKKNTFGKKKTTDKKEKEEKKTKTSLLAMPNTSKKTQKKDEEKEEKEGKKISIDKLKTIYTILIDEPLPKIEPEEEERKFLIKTIKKALK